MHDVYVYTPYIHIYAVYAYLYLNIPCILMPSTYCVLLCRPKYKHDKRKIEQIENNRDERKEETNRNPKRVFRLYWFLN